MPFRPILQIVAPATPNLGGTRGDLEPMMADEEEVIGSLLDPVEDSLGGDDPTENIPEYFGRKRGYVQQRVPSAFELDYSPLVLCDLLLQSPYGPDVDLAA